MSIFTAFGDATPTTPEGQFSRRASKGSGYMYRARYNWGQPALFANTPLELMNPEFACLWQEFITNLDCSTVQGAAGEPGGTWELNGLGGATPTFDILMDCQNGVATLDVGDDTDNLGAQIQLYPSTYGATAYGTAAGECIRPATQEVVGWAICGKMPSPLSTDWFIGLAEDGAAGVIDNAGAMQNDHYIGFLHTAASTTVDLVQQGNGAADLVITTPLADLWTPEDGEDPLLLRELGIRIEDNDKMYWYVNRHCVGATQVGNAETGGTVEAFGHGMTPTVCVYNTSQVQGIVYIDYHGFQCSRVLAPTGAGDL